MSDSLHSVRRAYGLAARPPDPGAAAEDELLRQMRRLLDAAPPARPTPESVAAVEAAAADAGDHGALRAALDGTADGPEAELIRQSLAALDTLPAASPDDATLAAILAAAADASSDLAPLRATYGLGDADGDPVETALLGQMRVALDSSRIQARPDASALDAVLAHAAAASATQETGVTTAAPSLAAVYGAADGTSVESAVMLGADQALDRLPIERPSGDAVAAVLAAAAAATRESRIAPVQAAPAPSPSVPLAASRSIASPAAAAPAALWARRPAVWAGAAAMLAAVVVSISLFRAEPAPVAEVAAFMEQPEASETVEAEPIAEASPDVPAPAALSPPPPPSPISETARALANGGPMAGAAAATPSLSRSAVLAVPPLPRRSARADDSPARRTAPQPAPVVTRSAAPPQPAALMAAPVAAAELVAAPVAADLADASPVTKAPADMEAGWEAGEDVRLLSLRLQELRRQNEGLDWDEPAQAFGAPAASALGTTLGVQSVGMGRLGGVPAARARALVDSTTDR